MRKIERQVAKSSFGSKRVTAARATVSKHQAQRALNRAAELRAEKSSTKRDPK